MDLSVIGKLPLVSAVENCELQAIVVLKRNEAMGRSIPHLRAGMRLRRSAGALCLFLSFGQAAHAQLTPLRTEAVVIRIGAANEPLAKSVDQWRSVLLFGMQDRFAALTAREFLYLEGFKITALSRPNALAVGEMRRLWEDGLLEVISGVPATVGADTKIYLKIYFGTLGRQLARDQLSMEQTIKSGNVRESINGLSLVTLYALAEDAISKGKPPYVSCPLLGQARSLIKDLSERSTEGDPDQENTKQISALLGAAVDKRLGENSCAVPALSR